MKKASAPRPWKADARIDLHRLTASDAEEQLVKFLDQNFLQRRQRVLVISGAKMLLGVVHRVLDSHPLVEQHSPDNPGATRVWLGDPQHRFARAHH
jgi:DNA-nicking Smr family endonuclease